MFDLLIIPHSSITKKELDEIIKIKSIAWPYSYEEQTKWINANLKESDIHVLLKRENSFVAYLNLVSIDITFNGIPFSGFGVGNVCSKEKGRGWGKELMIRSNSFIEKRNKVGLLFCKNNLVKFYSICNWKKIDETKLSVAFTSINIVGMFYNYDQPIHLIEFPGRLF